LNLSRNKYRELAEKNNALSIFAQPWWLDAVCGTDNWDAFADENKFVFAYHQKNKFFQTALIPSVLTPFQAVAKYDAALIHQLKQFDFVELFWKEIDITVQNELLKNNFQVEFKHTRELDVSDTEIVFKNFKPSLQRQIRKAEKNLTIKSNTDLETFYNVSSQTFLQQKKTIPYSFEQLKKIDAACKKNNAGTFLIAYNTAQEPCGAIYLVYDKTCCYYLVGGIATQQKNSGAMCLLIWEAIQFAATVSKRFDFYGSTIPSIDQFFSTFGAAKKEIAVINRFKNPLQKWLINKIKK